MNKAFTLGQIIAGAIVKGFDGLDDETISMLVNEFKREHKDYVYKRDFIPEWDCYLDYQEEKFYLRRDLKHNDKIIVKSKLRDFAGLDVSKFYDELNVHGFVLNKIYEKGGSYRIGFADNIFSKFEQEYVDEMYEWGYFGVDYDEYDVDDNLVFLTQCGKLALFKYLYKEELERFKKELKSRRINEQVLDGYLLNEDLSEIHIWSILNVDKLNQYCNEYGKVFPENSTSEVHFNKIDLSKNSDGSDRKIISDLLTVFDNGHCIYVCHPNHIFNGYPLLTEDVYDINNINWDYINIDKMKDKNDFKEFIIPDEAFKYITKRLQHMLKKSILTNSKRNAYLTVIEQYPIYYQNNYLVRGIIKADVESLYVAFNPEYEQVIPKSNFEKGLRYVGNNTPKVYLKRRNNFRY